MTTLTQPSPHTPTARRRPPRRAAHSRVRQARTRRSFDGLVASYLRELRAAR